MYARIAFRLLLTSVTALAAIAMLPTVALGAVRYQALVIGNNSGSRVDGTSPQSDHGLPSLRFADDDAAAFYELLRNTTHNAHLLTVMDRETQLRYPRLAAIARPPSLPEVRRAIESLAAGIERDHARGDRTILFIFFSGHGSVTNEGASSLALLDGGITQQILYNDILGRLSADYVHVFVDACHAEAIVRPRDSNVDTQAEVVQVAPEQANAFLVKATLARYPHVGAIVAATAEARSHEWDVVGHGVFTHELLSALRGAADVNRDGKIEYSEIYAFIVAANRSVNDPRARLSVVARPPDLDRRATVFDVSNLERAVVTRLTEVPGGAGLVRVEDEGGDLLATFHGEPGFLADLLIPVGRTIYVRKGDREARFQSASGEDMAFDRLIFLKPQGRVRSALDDALDRGLFASEFGRRYYIGFIDQAADFASVSFPVGRTAALEVPRPAPDSIEVPTRGAGSLAVISAGLAPPVARELDVGWGLRAGFRPAERGLFATADIFRASRPELTEKRITLSAGWLRVARVGTASAWFGGAAGAGAVFQTVNAGDSLWSAVVTAGPLIGINMSITDRLGIAGEAQVTGATYRRDGRVALSLEPAAWLGLSVSL